MMNKHSCSHSAGLIPFFVPPSFSCCMAAKRHAARCWAVPAQIRYGMSTYEYMHHYCITTSLSVGTTVFKYQLGVSFAGEVGNANNNIILLYLCVSQIVFASGPHLGTSSDVNLFRWFGPIRLPWEWWLADGGDVVALA